VLDEMMTRSSRARRSSIACAVVTGASDKSFSAPAIFMRAKRLNFTNACMERPHTRLGDDDRGLPIPVIAMVNGWCMGGGHEPLCDVVIASENAVLGQTG
jgi:enoyl-CoA hydratase/carnithine racemase